MNYAIGIDGGGTKTHLRALSMERGPLFEAFGGGSNLTALSDLQVEENLRELLKRFFQESGLSPEGCEGVCLGTAGAGSGLVREKLLKMFAHILPGTWALVTDDALPALYGGTLTGQGVILIAGTGSICLARSEAGTTCRTGGWGHILGDEGSGYGISVAMLREVMRALDGRGRPTLLTGLLLKELGCDGPMGVVDAVYHSGRGKSELAGLAFLCEIAYNKGDETAIAIIRDAAASLCELAVTAASRLNLPVSFGAGRTPCVYSGGMLLKSNALRAELEGVFRAAAPCVKLMEPLEDAAYGCALMALAGEERQ